MANGCTPLKALFVADGSGGHLIPALETAATLASAGAEVRLWYAQRPQTLGWAHAMARQVVGDRVTVAAIPVAGGARLIDRLRHGSRLWAEAGRCLDTFAPDVVVGFGGWISAPVVMAARLRRIKCVIHEQNAVMGRANRWLAPWVHRVAVTFPQAGDRRTVKTGLPVRRAIGHAQRGDAAARFGLDAGRPTLAVIGGSQGARAVNRIVVDALGRALPEEQHRWQVLHITGPADEAMARQAYAERGIAAHVTAFLADMADAYAMADVVVSRAGASTIAELARCGLPAILIPYPHARGHQRANARLVAASGGGVVIEESRLAAALLLDTVRRLLADADCRDAMRAGIRTLGVLDAAQRLSDAIADVARQ